MKSNNGLQSAAKDHLALLKRSHETQEQQDRLYIGLAFTYGLTVAQIALESGIPEPRVRHLLVGA